MNLDDCAVPQAEGTGTTLASPEPRSTTEAVPDFYRQLEPDLARELLQTATRIHNRTTHAYLETGRDLLAIKKN